MADFQFQYIIGHVLNNDNIIAFILFRTGHIYDAVELQNTKASLSAEYESPLSVSSSGKVPPTNKPKEEVKADTIKLQKNPAYKATNEFS